MEEIGPGIFASCVASKSAPAKSRTGMSLGVRRRSPDDLRNVTMSGIWTTWSIICRFIHETVGFRTGLAIDEATLERDLATIGAPLTAYLVAEPSPRYRPADIDQSVRMLLANYGDPIADTPYPFVAVMAELRTNAHTREIVEYLLQGQFPSLWGTVLTEDTPWDQLSKRVAHYGRDGVAVLDRLRDAFERESHLCSWSSQRHVAWTDLLELRELSSSEGVRAVHGVFFDQRFVRYLARDFERLDTMNWRKFEALVAERFVRLGMQVDLGPGRADGGIDIRVRPRDCGDEGISLIIIQCKRQRSTVDQVVIKALAADVEWESADYGLLVTTSRPSPSAKQVISARSYPVQVVNREALQSWITELASHGSGLWMPTDRRPRNAESGPTPVSDA